MTTATSEAIEEQISLLGKFADIILALIKNPAASVREKAEAEARVAKLLEADAFNAEAIQAVNLKLQELLDLAAAAILPIPVVEESPAEPLSDDDE